MSAAQEVAWLAEQTGQSVADLLAIPAAAYAAVKERTLNRWIREAKAAAEADRTLKRRSLMDDFKRQMGRA